MRRPGRIVLGDCHGHTVGAFDDDELLCPRAETTGRCVVLLFAFPGGIVRNVHVGKDVHCRQATAHSG